MSIQTTQVSEATVKVKVKKTGKTYFRTMHYAKHIIKRHVKEPKETATHEYFLRKGRGWRQVTKEEFEEATSKEAVKRLHEQLGQEIRQQAEREMRP